MLLDPGDCGCCAGGGTLRVSTSCGATSAVNLFGFSASPTAGVVGATVTLYSDSGRSALVASGTTNSVGRVDLTSLTAGTYYLRISGPSSRWSTYDPAGTVSIAGTGTTDRGITLAPASGYACRPCCPFGEPVSQTLHATTPFGSATIVQSTPGGAWFGSLSVPYAGDPGCPATTVGMDVSLSGCGITFGFPINSFGCPGASPATDAATGAVNFTDLSCSGAYAPSGTASGTFSGTVARVTAWTRLTGSSTFSWAVAVTE